MLSVAFIAAASARPPAGGGKGEKEGALPGSDAVEQRRFRRSRYALQLRVPLRWFHPKMIVAKLPRSPHAPSPCAECTMGGGVTRRDRLGESRHPS